jgi:RNA polymerase sigma factor (TIGR02999 family)
MADVSLILEAVAAGDSQATSELFLLVYDSLRQMAARKLAAEPAGGSLQATDLVHEVFLRLVGSAKDQHWNSRYHFFMATAEAMRRILIEYARKRLANKRGGGQTRVQLDEACLITREPQEDVLALDEALGRLAQIHPQKAELVKLHYFAGFTLTEAAELLSISRSTANRHWFFARAWLYREITQEGA